MKSAYATFYVDGRADRLIKNDIDTEEIAAAVIAGKGTIQALIRTAVTSAAEPLRVDRKKRRWIEDYEDEIETAGGDGEEAYRHYLDGKIDEICHSLEPEVIEDMTEIVSDADGGDEDDSDEDESDEDDSVDDKETPNDD